ncbi:MAG: hypothetical protein L7S47_07335 [Acidimicrobiales bacterium]|nr:hypothetical protein [Acidimicrobiales bacterium]
MKSPYLSGNCKLYVIIARSAQSIYTAFHRLLLGADFFWVSKGVCLMQPDE